MYIETKKKPGLQCQDISKLIFFQIIHFSLFSINITECLLVVGKVDVFCLSNAFPGSDPPSWHWFRPQTHNSAVGAGGAGLEIPPAPPDAAGLVRNRCTTLSFDLPQPPLLVFSPSYCPMKHSVPKLELPLDSTWLSVVHNWAKEILANFYLN